MLPRNRVSTHPGEILQKEFLGPLGVSQSQFAVHVGVPFQRINEIVNGKRGITPETAWLFADALGTTAEFWMGLQASHDLTRHRAARHVSRLRATPRRMAKAG
jgi:addiction module HigA family antidote